MKSSANSSLTLVFIRPQQAHVPEPSYDPIFKFDKFQEAIPRFQVGQTYTSSSQTFRILGCVDVTRETGLKPHEMSGALQLLADSAVHSTISETLSNQRARGLAATKLLQSGGYSGPIKNGHWRVEAERMFQMSISRILVEMKNFEEGAMSRYGFPRIDNGTRPALCDNAFFFRSQGWRNVNVTGSVWTLVLSSLIILVAVPVDEEDLLLAPLWRYISAILWTITSKSFRGVRVAYACINTGAQDLIQCMRRRSIKERAPSFPLSSILP